MVEEENLDDMDIGAIGKNISVKKVKNMAFSKLPRELSEKDLSNPSISKMLLSEIDNLENKVINLENLQEAFHKVDKEKCILEEKLKKNRFTEILSQFCFTLGGGLLTISTLDFSIPVKINHWIFLIFGMLTLMGAIFSSWSKQ